MVSVCLCGFCVPSDYGGGQVISGSHTIMHVISSLMINNLITS